MNHAPNVPAQTNNGKFHVGSFTNDFSEQFFLPLQTCSKCKHY